MMHNPPHVGEILREMYLIPLEISVTEAATHLGITRQALSRLINEKSSISSEMAIRLAKAFATTPEYWMNLATQYELWQAQQRFQHVDIKPFGEAAWVR